MSSISEKTEAKKTASQDYINICDSEGKLMACIIRASFQPPQTSFLSPPEINPQYGIIAYPKGHTIPRHYHNPIQRTPVGTPETLVVRNGNITAEIYNENKELINTYNLAPNDIIVLVAGGHGFTFIEDAWLFEVKQGPYAGSTQKDKVHF